MNDAVIVSRVRLRPCLAYGGRAARVLLGRDREVRGCRRAVKEAGQFQPPQFGQQAAGVLAVADPRDRRRVRVQLSLGGGPGRRLVTGEKLRETGPGGGP